MRGGVCFCLEEFVEARAVFARHGGHEGGDDAQDHECGENRCSLPVRARGEQHRHGEHRADFSPGAVCDDRAADFCIHELALAQNGHERSERRGHKHDGHGNHSDAADGQIRMQEHERQRECEGDQPRTQALFAFGAREHFRVDFVAREQEQKREAQIGKQRNRLGEPNMVHAVRAEDCAESQKKNGFGNGLFRNRLRDNGCHKCDNCNNCERDEIVCHKMLPVVGPYRPLSNMISIGVFEASWAKSAKRR